jgi:hypothetical protein
MEGVFRRRRRGLRVRTLAVLLVAVIAGVVAAIGVRWWQYEEHVLPGVRVAGVDVGGLSAAQAQTVLESELGARLERRVPVRVRDRLVRVRPATALRLDAATSATVALQAARGSFWDHVRSLGVVGVPERKVAPVVRIDGYGAAGTMKKLDKGLPEP